MLGKPGSQSVGRMGRTGEGINCNGGKLEVTKIWIFAKYQRFLQYVEHL